MQEVRSRLPRNNARYSALRSAKHVETDQLGKIAGEHASVCPRVDERKMTYRLSGCRIANDDRYDRPLDAARESLIGELHGQQKCRDSPERDTGSDPASLSQR